MSSSRALYLRNAGKSTGIRRAFRLFVMYNVMVISQSWAPSFGNERIEVEAWCRAKELETPCQKYSSVQSVRGIFTQ